jgi:DNA-binding MarR family transcriptional regulator
VSVQDNQQPIKTLSKESKCNQSPDIGGLRQTHGVPQLRPILCQYRDELDLVFETLLNYSDKYLSPQLLIKVEFPDMEYEQLKLENQVCFPIYTASRLIIRQYTPFLDELGITYPQYLVMLLLWETDHLTVNDITEKLLLNTNTITPLLKRLEAQGLITRQRSTEDERRVIVSLTTEGASMKEAAASIPERLVASLASNTMSVEDISTLVSQVCKIINHLSDK